MMASVSEESFDLSQPDGPYGQVLLFGDSITQNAFDTESGFSYGAALSHGETIPILKLLSLMQNS